MQLYQKKLFGTWQFGKIGVLVNFIIQKFARLKSKHFSQFFWWEVNLRGLRGFILQKVQALVVERQKKKFCYPSLSFGKDDTLIRIVSAWDRSRDLTAKIKLLNDMLKVTNLLSLHVGSGCVNYYFNTFQDRLAWKVLSWFWNHPLQS